MLKKNTEDIATTWLKAISIFHIQSKGHFTTDGIKMTWTYSHLKMTLEFGKFISYSHLNNFLKVSQTFSISSYIFLWADGRKPNNH